MYEAVKSFIIETSLVKFSIVTSQQNIILLPPYVLYKTPLRPGAMGTMLWSRTHLKTLLWQIKNYYLNLTVDCR
jgi:hypothetical protein